MMNGQEKHEMSFEKKHPSGADEWVCPTCGRRMLITWEPKFRRTVLVASDVNVTHDGIWIRIPIVGNLEFPFVEGPPSYEYRETIDLKIDEERLASWAAWLEKSSFEDLWNNDPR
jgi:hypothetical protein